MESKNILLIIIVVATACLGIALTILAYIHAVNIPPPAESLTKDLNVYSEIIKASPIGCPNDMTVCDYYMAGSGYTLIPGKTAYTYVTAQSIAKVAKGGARLIELDVYEVNRKPVVGLADIKSQKMLTYNTIPFEECCVAIANSAFSSDVTPGYNNPFVLSLVFHTADTTILTECSEIMKTTLRKFMLDSSYSYQRKNLATEPICNLMGKLIIVSGENIKGNGMDELVNMSWASSNLRRMTYTQAAQTYDHDELIEFNKRNLTLVVPDLDTTTLKNGNPEILFAYGCQWVAMSYGSLDNAMEVYTGKFLDGSFAVKPDVLRYSPVTYKKPKPQDPAVSFQPKRMVSPMYDYTIKSA